MADVGVPRVIWPVRAVMAIASVLVLIAGLQLFGLSTETELYFAWTIKPPLTAAFLGASYWASFFLVLSATLAPNWRIARVAMPAVLTFTVLTLIVTLLHIDRFHFDAPETLTVVSAWAWVAVYVTVPGLFALAIWLQVRSAGPDRAPKVPLPAWIRVIFIALTAIVVIVGLGLFFATATVAAWWPWPLTPLTGRAVSAWLLAFGVAGISLVRENDRPSIVWAALSFFLLGVLQLLALLRFPGDMDWSHPAAVPYVVFWIVVVVLGATTALIGGDSQRAYAGARPAFDGPGQRD